MTTLASWAAIDSRGVASLYLVSDSRFTVSGTGQVHTDAGQKVYVSAKEPHVFGFCGSANFPATAIPSLVDEIDQRTLFMPKENLNVRHQKVMEFLDTRLNQGLRKQAGRHISAFKILHAAREGQGLKCSFRLWVLSWFPFDSWRGSELPMPRYSKLIFEDGSGATALRIEHDNWQRSDVSRTSRAVFSAFCDALRARRDSYSGGAPQLGGLFRKFSGKYFGVIFGGATYYRGQPVVGSALPTDIEWFNETFERADPITTARLRNAQRQPRPWPPRTNRKHLP